MKILKNKLLLFLLIILLIISLGTGAYYIFISIEREVNITSFDNLVFLSFGKAKVSKIQTDTHYKRISFTARNDDMLNKIKNNKHVIMSIEEDNYAEYLLTYQGYFFNVGYLNERSRFSIENAFCLLFIDDTDYLYFPFLYPNMHINLRTTEEHRPNLIKWKMIPFASNFDELAEIYDKLGGPYFNKINNEDNTILLNCSLLVRDKGVMYEDVVLKLICNDEGVDFEVVYLKNDK
ncbi:MAG: hypothetical protein LBF12_05525 [Christensenellaceae bacterium]|jgi:hypothetical protein|nr:hypothetical protein [Christensenellaceae bacterium]